MKILVVEDEHLIANSIKKGLEQESYTVDLAFDGEAGLDLALSGDYDLMILDLMLPKLDGISISKQVRENGVHSPVLILTAKDQLKDKVTGLDSGADDYLTKPFAFEELLARLRALKRRPEKIDGEVLQVQNLSLNTHTFEVKRGDQNISLSSKEYSLLEYLLRNKGKILSKDQIINHVWNYDTDILPNTVEVYIRYLREKIDKRFKPALIETVRGFGYKIGTK